MTGGPHGYLHAQGFKYDIFFSYARGSVGGVDDEEPPLQQWSRQFKELLERYLVHSLRVPVTIYFDGSIDGSDQEIPLEEDLESSVGVSALFHLVMSPHYLGSKRCRTELTRFGARLPPSWSDRRGRIFVARAVDTGQEPWPDELRNEQDRVSNWRFYGDDDHNPLGFMRDWKGFVPDKMAGNFTRLANGVLDALENFQNEQVKEASQSKRNTKLRTGHAESIYLYAHPKEPAVWRAAKRKLEELGIKVLPDKPEDAGADSDRKQRDALIDAASRCDVMLMVSADPDRLQNDLEQIGRNRRQLIASRKKKYLPCAFVDQGGLLDADLLRNSAAPFDIDWLAVNNANWAELLRDWLRSAAEKIQKREGRQPHDPRGNSA